MLTAKTSAVDRWSRLALAALVTADLVFGVVLRFWTTSKLWLDEAQSINIASQPISQLDHYLRNDGAPPLYYVLLHVWMGVVGHSDADVRALSGVISIIGLAAAYGAARRWWDGRVALVSVAVLAVLPFAVYFGTEARMYSLVMLESGLLLWVLRGHLDRPRWSTGFGLAILGASLLYTQYWGIYLLLVVGAYVAARWWFRRSTVPKSALSGAVALIGSFVLWLPWFPIFNEQRLHTGTPWSPPPGLAQVFTWPEDFTVNQSIPHVITSLHTQVTLVVFVALGILGVLAANMTRGKALIPLNAFGDPRARAFSFIALGTMALGIVASNVDGAAYVPRYASVVVLPLVFLVARGIMILNTPARIFVALALLSGACLWTDKWGVTVQRTQAGQISAALANAPKNAIVFVCPDQLGPSLLRYSNPDLTYVGYPRFNKPWIVNWYNYLGVYAAHTPGENALREAQTIQPDRPVYVVRAPNYGLKLTCYSFQQQLAADLHRVAVPIVKLAPNGYYQPMEMVELETITY